MIRWYDRLGIEFYPLSIFNFNDVNESPFYVADRKCYGDIWTDSFEEGSAVIPKDDAAELSRSIKGYIGWKHRFPEGTGWRFDVVDMNDNIIFDSTSMGISVLPEYNDGEWTHHAISLRVPYGAVIGNNEGYVMQARMWRKLPNCPEDFDPIATSRIRFYNYKYIHTQVLNFNYFNINGDVNQQRLRLGGWGDSYEGWSRIIEGGLEVGALAYAVDDSNFRDQRTNPNVLRSKPRRTATLTIGSTDGVPEYIGGIVNQIFACDLVFVNGMHVVRMEGASPEVVTLDKSYSKVVIRQEVEIVDDGYKNVREYLNYVDALPEDGIDRTYRFAYELNGGILNGLGVGTLPGRYMSGKLITVTNIIPIFNDGNRFIRWMRLDNRQIVKGGSSLTMPSYNLVISAQKGIIEDSYYVDLYDEIHEFKLANTPIAAFASSGDSLSNIVINGKEVIKNSIKEIYFASSYNDIITIPNNFLFACVNTKIIDLSGLKNVTSVGLSFLYKCQSLIDLDLSPLSNINILQGDFLRECKALINVDFSKLSKVTTIGASFMRDCTSIEFVNLSYLYNVTTIGDYFMYQCTSLQNVNISGFTKPTAVPAYFFQGCTSLLSLDASSFVNATSIGISFLHNCSSLLSVNLSAFTKVTLLNRYFLQGCGALLAVDLSAFYNVTTIEQYVFYQCKALTSIDLTMFTKVTRIYPYFMNSCSGLQNVNMSGFIALTQIDQNFFSSCPGIKDITIGNVDVGAKTVNTSQAFNSTPNVNTSVIRTHDAVYGGNFKTKFTGLSNWNIIIY